MPADEAFVSAHHSPAHKVALEECLLAHKDDLAPACRESFSGIHDECYALKMKYCSDELPHPLALFACLDASRAKPEASPKCQALLEDTKRKYMQKDDL